MLGAAACALLHACVLNVADVAESCVSLSDGEAHVAAAWRIAAGPDLLRLVDASCCRLREYVREHSRTMQASGMNIGELAGSTSTLFGCASMRSNLQHTLVAARLAIQAHQF